MTILENIKRLEKLEKEHKEPGVTFQRVFENEKTNVIVWEKKVENEEQIDIEFISSVHWTEALELWYEGRYGEEPSWFINYGSGGTIGAHPSQIAEAMSIIFDRAKRYTETKPF